MPNQDKIQARLDKLREILDGKGLDGALFTSYENRRYYSGFTGSGGYLIVSLKDALLITDRRYVKQAAEQTDITVAEQNAGRQQRVAQEIAKLGIRNLAIEDATQAGEYFAIANEMPQVTVKLEGECFLEQRMRKDESECRMIREAVRCSDLAFEKLISKIGVGMTEKELADELHYLANREGAEALSFGTIVGSGPRGALAHATPGDRVIRSGEMVVVDFGVSRDGYVSDMTRTLLFGDVPQEMLDVHDTVYRAMKAAFSAIRPGAPAKDVEQAHRDVFLEAGLEEYALKGLGHGVGLQVHECPRIVIGNETILERDMIFTVEPGLYFPDRFGVRIEDVVRVTSDGYENFTQTPHIIRIPG